MISLATLLTTILSISLLLFLITSVHSQKVSKRHTLATTLEAQGCSNALVQHYIIDAARRSVSTKYLAIRLNGVSGYSFTDAQIAKW